MFNVGGGELLLILFLALIVLGPDKLPEFARKVGRVSSELRRMSHGFQQEMRDAIDFTGDAEDAVHRSERGPRLVAPPPTASAPDRGVDDGSGSDGPSSDTSAA
jgi:Tat protein translocase TatB subunit